MGSKRRSCALSKMADGQEGGGLDKIRNWVKTKVPWGDEEESDSESVKERPQMFPGASPALVTVSSDRTMRKWNVKTGHCERVFCGHDGGITSMCMDFDSWFAITGSTDNSLAMWDIKNSDWLGAIGEEKGVGHTGAISCVEADWPGGRCITGAYDHDLRLWDLKDGGECIRVMKEAHDGPVCCVYPDWKEGRAASGGRDCLTKIWDIETGVSTTTLKGHTLGVWACTVDPCWNLAMTGSRDRHVMLWDLRAGQIARAALKHEGFVTFLDVDWEQQKAVSGSSDRSIAIWDFSEGLEVEKWLTAPPGSRERDCFGHAGSVWCGHVDWPGKRMVSGGGPGDNAIHLWDMDDGWLETVINGHDGSVWNVFVDWEEAHRARRELEEALRGDTDDYVDEAAEPEKTEEPPAEAVEDSLPVDAADVEIALDEDGRPLSPIDPESNVAGAAREDQEVEAPPAAVAPELATPPKPAIQAEEVGGEWTRRGGRPPDTKIPGSSGLKPK